MLQVTNTEEKINQKEAELKQVADRFEKLRVDHEDLEKQHKQVLDEKNSLAEQLQAEVELCNEAEEVIVVLCRFDLNFSVEHLFIHSASWTLLIRFFSELSLT